MDTPKSQYQLSESDILQIQTQVNLRQIFINVFQLFKVKWKYDPNLSVKKIYSYFNTNPFFKETQKHIICMQKAHDEILQNYILKGYKF